jgi:hypothetical protein
VDFINQKTQESKPDRKSNVFVVDVKDRKSNAFVVDVKVNSLR